MRGNSNSIKHVSVSDLRFESFILLYTALRVQRSVRGGEMVCLLRCPPNLLHSTGFCVAAPPHAHSPLSLSHCYTCWCVVSRESPVKVGSAASTLRVPTLRICTYFLIFFLLRRLFGLALALYVVCRMLRLVNATAEVLVWTNDVS